MSQEQSKFKNKFSNFATQGQQTQKKVTISIATGATIIPDSKARRASISSVVSNNSNIQRQKTMLLTQQAASAAISIVKETLDIEKQRREYEEDQAKLAELEAELSSEEDFGDNNYNKALGQAEMLVKGSKQGRGSSLTNNVFGDIIDNAFKKSKYVGYKDNHKQERRKLLQNLQIKQGKRKEKLEKFQQQLELKEQLVRDQQSTNPSRLHQKRESTRQNANFLQVGPHGNSMKRGINSRNMQSRLSKGRESNMGVTVNILDSDLDESENLSQLSGSSQQSKRRPISAVSRNSKQYQKKSGEIEDRHMKHHNEELKGTEKTLNKKKGKHSGAIDQDQEVGQTDSRKKISKMASTQNSNKNSKIEEIDGKAGSWTKGSARNRNKQGVDMKSEFQRTEPLDVLSEAMEDFESKVLLKYSAELGQVEKTKITGEQISSLYAAFKNSIGVPLDKNVYTDLLMKTSEGFEALMEKINSLQGQLLKKNEKQQFVKQYLNNGNKAGDDQIDYSRRIPLSDCIAAEMDLDGNFNGFSIRPAMANMIFWRNEGDVKLLNKLIKTVNYMNRLLLEDGSEFVLKKNNGETGDMVEFGCTVNTFEPEIIIKEIEVIKEIKEGDVVQIQKEETEEQKKLFSVLQDHAIDILQRMTPSQTGYYKLVWARQTMHDLAIYKLPNVFESVPDNGIIDPNEKTKDISFTTYLEIMFKYIKEKLHRCILDKQDLSIRQLVYEPDLPEDSEKAVKQVSKGCQPDKEFMQIVMEEALKIQPKKKKQFDHTTQTKPISELFQELNKETGSFVITDQKTLLQIDKAMGDEMARMIDTMTDYIDKVKYREEMQPTNLVKPSVQHFNEKGSVTTGLSSLDVNSKREPVQRLGALREELVESRNEITNEILGIVNQQGLRNITNTLLRSVATGKRPMKVEENPFQSASFDMNATQRTPTHKNLLQTANSFKPVQSNTMYIDQNFSQSIHDHPQVPLIEKQDQFKYLNSKMNSQSPINDVFTQRFRPQPQSVHKTRPSSGTNNIKALANITLDMNSSHAITPINLEATNLINLQKKNSKYKLPSKRQPQAAFLDEGYARTTNNFFVGQSSNADTAASNLNITNQNNIRGNNGLYSKQHPLKQTM